MKLLFPALICMLTCTFVKAQGIQAQAQGQDMIEPGSTSINPAYLKPRNIFEKLSWFDSTGKLVRQRVLNLVTKIDSVHKKLIFLQIRNDGYKDSTIAEWPTLKPIYTEEDQFGTITSYDHSGGNVVKVVVTKNGKKISDTSIAVNTPYIDGFLSDYVYGSLPLKPGYRGQVMLGSGHVSKVILREVHTDVLITGEGNTIQANLVIIDFPHSTALFWFDTSTGEILKSVYRGDDGSVFMKSRI
jgi:hypothetical protein